MNKSIRYAAAFRAAVGALAAGVAVPASAQQDPPAAVKVEKIEITGSNIKRIEGEGALPVTVISAEEIRRSGATTAAELLDKIPALSAGGYNVSLGVGDGFRPGLSAVSLRGLGGENTLVLLNGRRLSNYAFNGLGGGNVNLNQIPLAAVERVEVLKDGASAIYGTDAIAGVINFILRRDYQGAEATVYATQTESGGGDSRKLTGAVGWGDLAKDGFNVLATVDYQKDTPLKASQRPFASTAIRPDLGFAATSNNVFPANFRFQGVNYNLTAARGCVPSEGSFQVNAQTGAPAPSQTFCRYDFTSVLDIYPPSERLGFFVRGSARLGGEHQAFVEYHLGSNEITFAASETPVADFTGIGTFRYPAGGRYYPSTVTLPSGAVVRPTGDLEIFWRAKAGGLRTDRVDTDESRLVAGLEGVIRGWDYNTAVSHSRSIVSDNFIDGYLRESLLDAAIRTGLIDVFSGNPADAAAQALIDAAKILQTVRESKASVTSFDAKISRELTQLRGGPLALALGVDHRRETLEERPAEVLFSGDILGGGGAYPPTPKSDRTVTALFGELSIPILGNLEAQAAARYDKYSDFGSTFNPKVALRWTPTKAVLARGSYGTGFRAPTLSDLYLPSIPGFVGEFNDPVRCPGGEPIGNFVDPVTDCNGVFGGTFGGNPALQPERSRQWSLGFVLEPDGGASIGADYWSIRRRDSIGTLFPSTIFDVYGASDPVTAEGRFVRRARKPDGGCVGDLEVPTPASVPCSIDHVIDVQENLGQYAVSGVDVSASLRLPTASHGTFSFRLEGTYFLRYRYQILDGGAYFDAVGQNIGEIGAVPRWKHHATINWRRGPWGATLAHNFALGYRDQEFDFEPSRRVGSAETWDAQGTWEGWRGLAVTLGVRNVFDRDPPATKQGSTFQIGYDPRYTDPRGRTWYLGLKYAFK